MKYKLLDAYTITASTREMLIDRKMKRVRGYRLSGITPGGNIVDVYGRTKFTLNAKLERILKKENNK